MSLALLILIAVVALNAPLTPPPTISELAPQATRQITESSDELAAGSSPAGVGEQGPGGSGPPPGNSDEPPIEVSRVRRCIGDPPRQIEDPQSPPCVPYWKGDNSGATWRKGVTATEIRVAVANYPMAQGGNHEEFDRAIKIYEAFFNRRFEFYGRKLNLISFRPVRPAASSPEMAADAVKVDEEIGAFAATQYSEQDGKHSVYFDALAERQILGVMTGPGGISRADEAHMRRHAPYEWDYTPSANRFFQGYGEFLCKVLAHRPPIYAAPPESDKPERVFGIILDIGLGVPFDIEPLRERLRSCNAPLHEVVWTQSAEVTTQLLALRDKGVTSVMYTGQTGLLATRIMPQAQAQGYHPEWLIWTLGNQDSDEATLYFPKTELPHVLGVQAYNKVLRPEDMPYVWAANEIDDTASLIGDVYERLYKSLLLLASGIQTAGPKLTPHAFELGLMRTTFPNPGAAGPPYYQARVGFPGIHTMQQDLTMVWVSGTERSPATGLAPSYCYVQQGLRYGPGQWPSEDVAFFQPPCR